MELGMPRSSQQAGLGQIGLSYPFDSVNRDGPDSVGDEYGDGRGDQRMEGKGTSSSSGAQMFPFDRGNLEDTAVSKNERCSPWACYMFKRPNDVVTEHKKRATALWVTLLLVTVGFIVWQTVALVDKYNDPNTRFSVSDDPYRFPYTEVCMGHGSGCDWDTDRCIESVTARVWDPCGEEWDVQIESAPNSSACVTFDMGQVETETFPGKCLDASERPYVRVLMDWISDNQTSLEYSSSVFIFLGGADVQQAMSVPYTRFVSPDDQLIPEVSIAETELTIGKNVRSFLSGDNIINYPIVTSSTIYTITRDISGWYYYVYDHVLGSNASSSSSIGENSSSSIGGNSSSNTGENPVFGDLFFTLTLGSFSLTELSEENPIDMFDYIGNIGGFWEILLLVWGVFFISKHTGTTPRQEARSFSKTIQKGIPMVNRRSVATMPQRRRVTFTEEFDLDEYPNLNKSCTDPRQAKISSIDGPRQASSGSIDGPRRESSSNIHSYRQESGSSIHGRVSADESTV